jgi:hypothetical protein
MPSVRRRAAYTQGPRADGPELASIQGQDLGHGFADIAIVRIEMELADPRRQEVGDIPVKEVMRPDRHGEQRGP